MKIQFAKSYVHKVSRNTVFVYVVSGTASELDAYNQIQGENAKVDDEGNPLFFTTKFAGNNAKLLITSNGKVVADMSAFDQAASLSAQYGGNLGQELARSAAQMLLGGNHHVAQPTPAPAPAAHNDDDLSDL